MATTAESVPRGSSTSAALVRSARRGAGLTQVALASLGHDHQSTVSAIESGLRHALLDHVDVLVRATGHTVVLLPTPSRPVNLAADAVFTRLRRGDEQSALREVIQLSDDLRRESGAVRVALTACPPAPTGRRQYDALIAAVTDYWLAAEDLPHAAWLSRPELVLDSPWFIDDLPALRDHAIATAAPQFAARNVFVDVSILASV